MSLLERVGQGLIDIADGQALPPSPEGLDYCRALLREHQEDPDGWMPEEVEEAAEDLVAYVLTFQDQGLPMEAAVQCWAEEWELT